MLCVCVCVCVCVCHLMERLNGRRGLVYKLVEEPRGRGFATSNTLLRAAWLSSTPNMTVFGFGIYTAKFTFENQSNVPHVQFVAKS